MIRISDGEVFGNSSDLDKNPIENEEKKVEMMEKYKSGINQLANLVRDIKDW